MKLKKFHLLFTLIILTLCIGTVNAIDSDSDDSKEITTIDSDNSIEKTVNKISKEKQTTKTSSVTTKKINVDVEADEVAVEYNKTNYLTIKLEDKYDKAIKNTKINAKVISPTKNKTYTLTSNQYGIAKLNTKNLSIGTHKVIITSNNNNYNINKQTKIFVGKKETTTITPNTQKTLSNTDKIKLITKKDDEDTEVIVAYSGIPKYTKIIKAKFYYKNKINGKIITKIDQAEYDDGKWELPNEDYNSQKYTLTKVEIDYLTNKTTKTTTTINKTSTTTTKTTTTTKKTYVDVEADEIAVEHNKTQYLTIKLEDKKDKPMKNIKINAKVFTGNSSKTYTLTSNQYGIAKLNTKNLSIGTHKVIITSNNNNYNINKQTKIFVGKKETTTITPNTQKTLSNTDKIKLITKKDDEDTEVIVAYSGIPKYTKIIKAKFYYKNKINGKIITKIDQAEYDDGKWELPNEDYNSQKYTLTKVEVDYLTNKTTKTTTTINKTQKSNTNNTITPKKIKVDVDADEVAVEYKKNNYLTIKLEDNKDQALKNTKIFVKVFTGNTSKIYTLTTNNYGIAKLNTNNLSLGNHKVSITSNSTKYIINKQSNIFVGKKGLVNISINSQKVLNNNDTIKIVSKKINNNKNDVIVTYNGIPKSTKILKAKFYYKDKITGKVFTEIDSAEFDNGKWELPNEDYNSQKYTLTKVEVEYVTSK